MTPVGSIRPARLTCEPEHLPGCYNPTQGYTTCLCGTHRWPGNRGSVKTVARRHPTANSRILGWDTYQLHSDGCPLRGADGGHTRLHLCPARDDCPPTHRGRIQ